MSKGRKALPDNVKKIRGTNQKCRMSGSISVEGTSIKEISSTKNLKILRTKRAKDIFKTKANQLIAQNILTEFDLEQLGIYAVALDKCYECIEQMDTLVTTEISSSGTKLVVSPYVKMFKDMTTIVNQIGSAYGFTPVDRQKLKAEAPTQEDDLARFMKENL